MATNVEPTIELALTLRLSKQAIEKLAQRATAIGRDVAAVASDLIEQAVTRPTLDEALAPYRKQVAESGMSDESLDEFFRSEIEVHRMKRNLNRS